MRWLHGFYISLWVIAMFTLVTHFFSINGKPGPVSEVPESVTLTALGDSGSRMHSPLSERGQFSGVTGAAAIHLSVKTTPRYYDTRLIVLMITWMQTVPNPSQVGYRDPFFMLSLSYLTGKKGVPGSSVSGR